MPGHLLDCFLHCRPPVQHIAIEICTFTFFQRLLLIGFVVRKIPGTHDLTGKS